MIERSEISSLHNQIKSLRSEMRSGLNGLAGPAQELSWQQVGQASQVNPLQKVGEVKEVPSFGQLLKQAINLVNNQQGQANDLRTRYELGDPDVDLVNVMIASQKASVAFEATAQVRNKLVNAYQEIMRMPI